MTKKIGDKSISEWAREWGVSRQAASAYFKYNAHLSIEEIIENKKKQRSESKWSRISGKQAKEWAVEWGMSETTAQLVLSEMFPDHKERMK